MNKHHHLPLDVPLDLVAKLLDITPRRVQQLAVGGYVPKAERGLYPLVGAVQGYIKHLREQITTAPSGPEEKAARARKLTAEASLTEMDLALRAGEVGRVEDISAAVEDEYSLVRESVLSVTARMANDLSTEQLTTLSTELYQCLEDLSDVDTVLARAAGRSGAASRTASDPAPAAADELVGLGGRLSRGAAEDKRDARAVAVKPSTGRDRNRERRKPS